MTLPSTTVQKGIDNPLRVRVPHDVVLPVRTATTIFFVPVVLDHLISHKKENMPPS
jgi:hypothetical protein